MDYKQTASPKRRGCYNLTYGYNGNQLTYVDDTSNNPEGFTDNYAALEYTFDNNGNMISVVNKGITNIIYNYLNLPEVITLTGGTITFLYDANGNKLRKTVSGSSQDYLGGIEYKNNVVEAIYHEEGRATLQSGVWRYEYYLKDHLGNTRVIFTDNNDDGTPEIIQEADYYPFGMRHQNATATNHYLYNGKELNTDLGLDWYDYGFRWYDAELGRFPSVDPMAENRLDMTPFNYVSNNPISRIDPNGLTDFYYNSGEGKNPMVYLGTDGISNGTLAVIVDASVIEKMKNNKTLFINPPTDSYFELPSYSNRQRIKKEIVAHYGKKMSIDIDYEIGGVGLRLNNGLTYELNAKPGNPTAARPTISAVRAANISNVPSKYKRQTNFDDGNNYEILRRKYVAYSWHTHPLNDDCPSCYFLPSDMDLSPNSILQDVRNNFVIAPFNNSVNFFRIGKTKTTTLCCGHPAGTSGEIPLDWFLNIKDAEIPRIKTLNSSKF